MPSPCQLLVDPPAAGAWNMAVDEALLEQAAAGNECWWRFYRWDRPTLSLGYFQPYDDRRTHAASRECPAVRRLTGGGAIVHDRELTYSLAVPAGHPLAAARDRLYAEVHAALIETLARLGIRAELWAARSESGHSEPCHSERSEESGVRQGKILRCAQDDCDPDDCVPDDCVPDDCVPDDCAQSREPEPFLCFLRRTAADVVIFDQPGPGRGRGVKIAGSAQRRRRGAVLQHGSLLLERSACAAELPGLRDAGCPATAEELLAVWLPRLAAGLDLEFRPAAGGLPAEQRLRAEDLLQRRYAGGAWTVSRGRATES